jgi:DNA-binding NarL/FixJ family response regulator
VKKTILVFSALIIALLILFQLSKYSVASGTLKIEFVIAGIAVLFFIIGVYLNKKSLQKKKYNRERGEIDEEKITALGISKREYEILIKISEGFSNKEIGEALFVSESTVKTHISNLFVKLDARRRTQAIQKAKEMSIIL